MPQVLYIKHRTYNSKQNMIFCFCLQSCLSHAQLFVTLWTIAHQAPLSMGFSRQECWSGLLCSSPGDLPHPGIEHLTSPALAGGFFTTSTTWKGPWSFPPKNLLSGECILNGQKTFHITVVCGPPVHKQVYRISVV